MIIVDEIEIQTKDSFQVVSARITANGRKHRVWFRWKGQMCPTPADAYLAATIQPTMRLGSKLVIKGKVSERLLRNLSKIQDIYHCWDRTLSMVEVEVEAIRPWTSVSMQQNKQTLKSYDTKGGIEHKGIGCMFSGGVDSFYSVLKHLHEIDTLALVHGFDIMLDDQPLRANVSKSLRNAASRLGKTFIELETNIRHFSDRYAGWELYHGGALSACGIILSGHWTKIYIPATHTYAELFPWGSHPLLDHLFSTDLIEFEHDGCEATRVEKVEAISTSDVVMDTLRVCWENRKRTYNCGQCEKCLRTMVNLKIVDALDRCKTFNLPLDLQKVSKIVPQGENDRSFIKQNIESGERLGADPELLAALRKSLTRSFDFRPSTLYYKVQRKAASIARKLRSG